MSFILLLNLSPAHQTEHQTKIYSWIDRVELNNKIIRVTSSKKESDDELNQIFLTIGGEPDNVNFEHDRFSSLIKSPQGYLKVGQVSPLLSFLLNQPFSINNATLEDLQLINGIGPSLAGKIITYRESNGPIKSAFQLQNINGIGRTTAEKLSKYLAFTTKGESDR